MGRNVIAAIASYAGEPKTGAREEGKLALKHGLTHTRKTPITPGGTIPLGPILFSNVDAPEALALPQHIQNIEMMAGPRPTVLHRVLVLLSRLRQRRLFPKLSIFTGMMNAVQKMLSIGDGRSGMIVSTDTEKSGFVLWHLIATDPDGPNIPILPAAILVKKILSGDKLSPGAYHGGGQVNLTEFRNEWQDLKIIDGFRAKPRVDDSIYKQCLGESWITLPQAIQELHSVKDHASYKGRANIVRGRNPLANLVAGIFRFPKAGKDIAVTVNFTIKNRVERWERIFGEHAPMVSTQELGDFGDYGTIIERFGPISVALAIIAEPEGRLRNKAIAWYLFGLPMPKFLCPGGDIYEYEKDGAFHFHVDIRTPGLGRLVKYEGWLKKG